MTWGNPFRNAWKRSTPSGQAAAREAALSPEQAAGILSNEAAHHFKLVQFAAQDMERMNAISNARDAQTDKPGIAAVRRAIDDIRQGRISPEKSEQHLRQAAQAAVTEAESRPGPITNDDLATNRELQAATSRFNDLRCRLVAEMDQTNQRIITAGSISPLDARGGANSLKSNLEFTVRLIQAHVSIDQIFLSNKSVDCPAAPLPPTVENNEQTTGVRCQPPRA